MEPTPTFGTQLRQRRRALDLTQAQLAELVGCTTDMIRKIELGQRRPSQQVAERLATQLALSPDERPTFIRQARGVAEPALPPPPARALPTALTSLIGREAELRTIVARLTAPGVRLLTLTGPGGVGKTRCALQAAAVVPGFAEGVDVVALATLRDPALVLPAIARTLGLYERDGRPATALLSTRLAGQERLLVLDNFEHVLEAGPELGALLAACPGLRVLTTSRIPLHIAGEHEQPILPLALPEPAQLGAAEPDSYTAIRLFVERAQAVQPSFVLDDPDAVVTLCARLDGLPLAIELAARRMKLFTPRQLLAQLQQARHGQSSDVLLGNGPRDLWPHQQSLESTIGWSYNLLDPIARQAFEQLAVFAAGCTPDAAQAVVQLSAPAEPLRWLAALVEASLLQPSQPSAPEPRFTMLETVREYALARLAAAGQLNATRRRLVAYLTALAERSYPLLFGAEQETTLRQLDGELDNLRAALRGALAASEYDAALGLASRLGRYWNIRGFFSEGRNWLEQALRGAGAGADPTLRARALGALALLARRQSDRVTALRCAEESLSLWQTLGDQVGLAQSLSTRGTVALDMGDLAMARTHLEASLALWHAQGDQANVAVVLIELARLTEREGDIDGALVRFEESLALWRALGDQRGVAVVLNNLGIRAGQRGAYAEARPFFEESLALSRAVGNQATITATLLNLAQLALLEGELERVPALALEATALYRELGDQDGVVSGLELLGQLATRQGKPLRAAWLWGAATALREENALPRSSEEQEEYEAALAEARRLADDATFEAAWHRGRLIKVDQVLAELTEGMGHASTQREARPAAPL